MAAAAASQWEPGRAARMRARAVSNVLLILSPASFVMAPLETYARVLRFPAAIAALIAGILALCSLRHRPGSWRWRALATAALLTWSSGLLVRHLENPARGFGLSLAIVAIVAFIWPNPDLLGARQTGRPPAHATQEIVLCGTLALFVGVDAWRAGSLSQLTAGAALSALLLVNVGIGWRRAGRRLFPRALLVAALPAALLPILVHAAPLAAVHIDPSLAPIGLVSPLLVLSVAARRTILRAISTGDDNEPGLLDAILLHPARVLVLSFGVLCALGTVLLGLPVAATGTTALPPLDAAFTSVSATCVTGLAVVDTPLTFTAFGEGVILLLIQVGGLGIMVFSAAAFVLLGRRLSLSHERVAADIVGAAGRADLVQSLRTVLAVTVGTELLGAVLLTIGFARNGDAIATAIWRGVFTSISAFCNAGFALQSDSLVPYAADAYIMGVVSLIIVVGSLGPTVVAALVLRRDPQLRTLSTRLVLWSTAILIALPALVFMSAEWSGTLGHLSPVHKVVNAVFQSITLRTAGFNSIDLAQVQPVTWTVMIFVMFVGGSPGSTAGGAKTTTVALVVLSIIAAIRGEDHIRVFHRIVPTSTVLRATAVTTLGVLSCGAALIVLQATQKLPLDTAIFEAVSALATVGLSTGATGQLDEIGKLVIMACMFAGRVGPLTLFVLLESRERAPSNTTYPTETVAIG